MARYADIDVLLEHLTTSDEGNFRTAITQWLEMHQAEEVAPVTHAHWVEDSEVPWCSNCEGEIPYNFIGEFDEWYSTYCPNCGAIMDEEVDDE